MKIIQIFVAATLAVSTISCMANPANRATSKRYYDAAEKAFAAGDLRNAEIGYSRALLNARLAGDAPAALESALAEKLARVQGNLCKHAEAEKSFLEAIAAAERASGADSPRTFPVKIELAQLTFDIGAFSKAVGYFERAFAVGATLLREKGPADLAALMDDYAIALEKVDRSAEAARAKDEAQALRARGGAAAAVRSKQDYTPYPTSCK